MGGERQCTVSFFKFLITNASHSCYNVVKRESLNIINTMSHQPLSKLNHRTHYLQVALNSTLDEARKIIQQLPDSERIIIEAGTPLVKQYGEDGIRKIKNWYQEYHPAVAPYIVADLKTMDRGSTEVEMAARAGANAVVALGTAPTETLNAFIAACYSRGLDPMVDMMNVEFPLSVLRALKQVPPVVILHRGVDEEQFNKEKQIPLHEIQRIKGNYNIMISIAGGDTVREVQRSVFNGANIVVIWKSVYQSTSETMNLVRGFLKEIK